MSCQNRVASFPVPRAVVIQLHDDRKFIRIEYEFLVPHLLLGVVCFVCCVVFVVIEIVCGECVFACVVCGELFTDLLLMGDVWSCVCVACVWWCLLFGLA